MLSASDQDQRAFSPLSLLQIAGGAASTPASQSRDSTFTFFPTCTDLAHSPKHWSRLELQEQSFLLSSQAFESWLGKCATEMERCHLVPPPSTQRGRERERECVLKQDIPLPQKKKNKRQRNRTRVCVQVTNLIYDTFDIHTQPPASPLASIVVRQECSVPSVFVNWHGMICASMSTGSGASATPSSWPEKKHILTPPATLHCEFLMNPPPNPKPVELSNILGHLQLLSFAFELSITVYASLSAKRGVSRGYYCWWRCT